MVYVFPKETVDEINEDAKIFFEEFPELKPFNLALAIAKTYSEAGRYGFVENLRSGHYVHYRHEKQSKRLSGDNCTTIIPTLYIYLEAAGFKPQIVQFSGFRDIGRDKKKDHSKENASHFAIISEVGKKKPYLLDPFYSVFGPILEEGKNHLKIGKSPEFNSKTREFDKMEKFRVEDFAEMMERLKDPAESLDMLIAGQKLGGRYYFKKSLGGTHVYYLPEENEIKTRVYFSQYGVQDKSIFCKQKLDDEGQTLDEKIEFYLAKDQSWANLIDGKKIAEMTFKEAKKLRSKIRRIADINKYERIGPELLKKKNNQQKKELFEIVNGLMQKMGRENMRAIKKQVLARTLYETKKPLAKRIYSIAKRDATLIQKQEKEWELRDKEVKLQHKLFFHSWKVKRLKPNIARKYRFEQKKIKKQKSGLVANIDKLNNLRYNNRGSYDLITDQLLFAQELAGLSEDALEQKVADLNLNPRIGYLAIIGDFLALALSAKDELELKHYISPVREKVKARKSKAKK